ncbi:hypothetical protein CNEO4_480015 [Clostridium neonatale]|uniref:Uncharacterized protein n=1 Tax=Clostridium neonatale TaxID=137838 RepID=A0AA86JRZ1_9CLOT|nr:MULTISPECIES: hypothetical protein [Clostridium]CAG9709746.1 hypothetical protein CNEO_44382 [Clostridium neonatale]CAG9712481.1 hypothetical protein CNEO_470006 [Clostridium neonatale]CAG9716068.1 hypothetical protein CNEO_380069 [Clostridium neonatale]CAI3197428.1 hypothetical protein CNEO2_220064 [Clostridium neonatale]CAI3202072.1 hypothetical protein CNEO2_200013 [Clostridium neonatale]
MYKFSAGVEIHEANGYIVAQFLSKSTNKLRFSIVLDVCKSV